VNPQPGVAMPPMPQHVFSSKILDHLNDLKISKDIQDPNLEMVQNPPKNNLCKCLPPNFHRQIYDLPIRAGRVPTLGPDRGSPPFAPKALPAMDLSNQQQQTLGKNVGFTFSNVEMSQM